MPRRKASGPGNGPAKGAGSARPTMPGFTPEERAKSRRVQAEKRAERKAAAEAKLRAEAEAHVSEVLGGLPATIDPEAADALIEAGDMPVADTRDFVRQQIRQWAAKRREMDPNFKPLARQLNAAEIENAFADLTEPAIQALFDVLTDPRAWAKDKILAAQEILNRRMGGIQQRVQHSHDDLAGKTTDELREMFVAAAREAGMTIEGELAEPDGTDE